MRPILLATALLLTSPALAPAAFAQDGKNWEPAPVPGDGVDTVAPVDRAGAGGGREMNVGPRSATPFSGPPTSEVITRGQAAPIIRTPGGVGDEAR